MEGQLRRSKLLLRNAEVRLRGGVVGQGQREDESGWHHVASGGWGTCRVTANPWLPWGNLRNTCVRVVPSEVPGGPFDLRRLSGVVGHRGRCSRRIDRAPAAAFISWTPASARGTRSRETLTFGDERSVSRHGTPPPNGFDIAPHVYHQVMLYFGLYFPCEFVPAPSRGCAKFPRNPPPRSERW